MPWPVYSPFAREHYTRGFEVGLAVGRAEALIEDKTEGKAKQKVRMILLILAARGVYVPDDVKEQIAACTNLAQLEILINRAITAATHEYLFEDADEQLD